MRMLELFSGTKSVSRVFENHGWECVSLDLKNASIETNILDWDYKQFPPGYFGFVWASDIGTSGTSLRYLVGI